LCQRLADCSSDAAHAAAHQSDAFVHMVLSSLFFGVDRDHLSYLD
jgi:hypothetical protein